MPRSRCFAVSVLLLALAVTASATSPASPLEEHRQDKRTVKAMGLMGEPMMSLLPEGTRVVKPSGAVATQGDDQSSSSGGSSSSAGSGEHSKEGEGSSNNKEGEKHGKSCLTKEECHKKKIICGKGCTLSAHSKCAAKCSKSCVPTC